MGPPMISEGRVSEVLVRYSVEGRVERRVSGRLAPERVELRGPMPESLMCLTCLEAPTAFSTSTSGATCCPLASGVPTHGGLQDSKSLICPSTESGSSL